MLHDDNGVLAGEGEESRVGITLEHAEATVRRRIHLRGSADVLEIEVLVLALEREHPLVRQDLLEQQIDARPEEIGGIDYRSGPILLILEGRGEREDVPGLPVVGAARVVAGFSSMFRKLKLSRAA